MITQSSSAQNRSLGAWYIMIKLGQIKLPRFQRMESWDRNRIKSFMDAVLKNLPVGVSLIYERGDDEKFISRFISTSEPSNPERLTEYLLDGQQRLTSYWRTMHNNYENVTFYLYVPDYDKSDDNINFDEQTVYCLARWEKNANRYPLWADKPPICFEKGLIPLELFNPDSGDIKSNDWIDLATSKLKPTDKSDAEVYFSRYESYTNIKSELKDLITKKREQVKHFNLPYLALPLTTHKEVALQVFINMNTNSKPLSLYDIIVAEVEGVKGESLHDLQNILDNQNNEIKRYSDLSKLILSTSALLQNKLPNNRGMLDMCKSLMIDNWDKLTRCLDRMTEFLKNNKIFDKQRLPTNAVLAVIAASYSYIPDAGDLRGKIEILLKKYLWSSFFTDRYENSAASKAFNDFQALVTVIKNIQNQNVDAYDESIIPVLNREKHPIATIDELISVGWPKQENIRGRAIMAVSSLLGAIDFADGQVLSSTNISSREYHHLFPDSLLKEANIDSFKALNCALITWKTNRIIGREDPLEYIKKRSEWSDQNIVENRLSSHLIPIKELSTGGYSQIDGFAKNEKIKEDFNKFIMQRAKLMLIASKELCNGQDISSDKIFSLRKNENV